MTDDPRVQRWLRVSRFAHESDAARELRIAIVLIAEDPSDASARDRLRALAAEHERWEHAAFFLAAEVRLTRDPTVVAVLQEEVAHAHAQLDKPAETIAELHTTADREPGNVDARDRLARLYYLAGAWAKTAEALEQLANVAHAELALAALHAAGRLYRDHGRPDRALAAYRAVAMRRPGDREALVALAELINDPDLPPAPTAIEDAPIRPDTTLGAVDDGAHLTLDEIDDAELESGIAGLFGHTPVPTPISPQALELAPAVLGAVEPAPAFEIPPALSSGGGEPTPRPPRSDRPSALRTHVGPAPAPSTKPIPRIVKTPSLVPPPELDGHATVVEPGLLELTPLPTLPRPDTTLEQMPVVDGREETRFEEARLRSALKIRPNDLLTHLALVELLCDDDRITEAVDHLRATIGKSRVNDAQLWCKLGDVERLRDKHAAALTAYRRTLMVAADSPSTAAAQRGLAELATLDHGGLHALVAKEHHGADALCLARELAGAGDAIGAHVMYDLAHALGAELGTRDHELAARLVPRSIAVHEDYAGALRLDEQKLLVDDPDDEPMRGLLDILGEAMSVVGPTPSTALDRTRIRDAKPLLDDDPLGVVFARIAAALAGPEPVLFASEDESHADPLVLLAVPAVVVVGPYMLSLSRRSLDHDDPALDAALRFDLGRAVELSRPHRVLAVGTTPDVFARIVGGVLAAFGSRSAPADRATTALVTRFRSALPETLRQRLTAYLADRDSRLFDPEAYRVASERAADRAGLIACGAVEPALGLAGGPEHAQHLVRLAAMPAFLAVQRRLRGA